jgi:hypothetical protein
MSVAQASDLRGTTSATDTNAPKFDPKALLSGQTPIKLPKDTSDASKVKVDVTTTSASGTSERPVINGDAVTNVNGTQTQTKVTAPLGATTTLTIQNTDRSITGETTTTTTNPKTGATRVVETPFDQLNNTINLGISEKLTPGKTTNPQVTVGADVQRSITDNNVNGQTTTADRFRITGTETFKLGPDTSLIFNQSAAYVNSQTDELPSTQTLQLGGSARVNQKLGTQTSIFGEAGATLNQRLDGNLAPGADRTTVGGYVQGGVTHNFTPTFSTELSGWFGDGPGTNPLSPSTGGGDGSSSGARFDVRYKF